MHTTMYHIDVIMSEMSQITSVSIGSFVFHSCVLYAENTDYILNINDNECLMVYYNMTVWILARKEINFSMAAGLIRLHMPGVK